MPSIAVGKIGKTSEKKVINASPLEFLKETLWTSPKEQIGQAESSLMQAATDPKANKLTLVADVTQAEIELQKVVTVLAKAHKASDEVLHMTL
jgi:flagellar hook-basal body complex protein FliE